MTRIATRLAGFAFGVFVLAALSLSPADAQSHVQNPAFERVQAFGGPSARQRERRARRVQRLQQQFGNSTGSPGCGHAIATIENNTRGRVISAEIIVDRGRTACRLVVLVPSRNPNRPPRRRVVIVPAN